MSKIVHINSDTWENSCSINGTALVMLANQQKKIALFTDENFYVNILKQSLKKQIPNEEERKEIEDCMVVTVDRSLPSIIVHNRQKIKESKFDCIFCAFVNKFVNRNSLIELQKETGSLVIILDPSQHFNPPITSISITEPAVNIKKTLTQILQQS